MCDTMCMSKPKKYTVYNTFTGAVVGQYNTKWGVKRKFKRARGSFVDLSGFLAVAYTSDVEIG